MTSKDILLVEDHESTRRVTGRLLEKLGFQVTSAGSFQEANAQIGKQTPQILLSDLYLLDGSGLDLMRHLSANSPAIGIAVTGADSAEDRQAAKDAGFQHFLVKPIDWEALKALLNSL